MKLFNEIANQMQMYYLKRDFKALDEIVRLVTSEINDPELQEVSITVPVGMDALEQSINSEGFLRMGLNDAESTGPVIEGKLIRVFSQNQTEDDSCMVLNVAHIDNAQIILVPSGGTVQ